MPTALLSPILPGASVALLYSARGLGKTFLALAIARAVAAGEGFLAWHGSGRPRRVLYIEGEMAAADIVRRLTPLGPSRPRSSCCWRTAAPRRCPTCRPMRA